MEEKLHQISDFKHGLASTISSMPSKLEQTNKIIGKVKIRQDQSSQINLYPLNTKQE